MMPRPHPAPLACRALALLLAATAGCAAPPAATPIRIGVLASLTGSRVGLSGEATRDGATLAAREINAAGGVEMDGVRHPVELVVTDIGDGTDMATSAAQALLSRPDIAALVGPQYSRNALPVAVLAEHAGVPMIAPMASHPGVTEGRRWVFRIAFTDDVQAAALARWAREGLHARRAAMIYEESAAYSRGIATQFTTAFESAGGRVVASEPYTRDRAGDFTDAIRRIRAAHADVLLLPNELPDDTLQIRQASALGLAVPFLLADFVDPSVMSTLPAPAGLYTTHHWSVDGPAPENSAFVAAFTRAFGHEPNATAATTYDAVRLLADAMRRAHDAAPIPVRDAIAATRHYRGATGTLDFAGRQDPAKHALVMRVAGNRLTVVRDMTP